MALYVASIALFCFPHLVDVNSLNKYIVLRVFVVVLSICFVCEFSVERESFGVNVHGKCGVVYL